MISKSLFQLKVSKSIELPKAHGTTIYKVRNSKRVAGIHSSTPLGKICCYNIFVNLNIRNERPVAEREDKYSKY